MIQSKEAEGSMTDVDTAKIKLLTFAAYQLPDLDSRLASPIPRPRLSSFNTKTLMSNTKTRLETYNTNTVSPWLGWTVTNKKTEKVVASRKSSIPVVAHSKQQNIIPCLTTVLFRQLPLIIQCVMVSIVPSPKTETRGFQDQDSEVQGQDRD